MFQVCHFGSQWTPHGKEPTIALPHGPLPSGGLNEFHFPRSPTAGRRSATRRIFTLDTRIAPGVDTLVAEPALLPPAKITRFVHRFGPFALLIEPPRVKVDVGSGVLVTVELQHDLVNGSQDDVLAGREQRSKAGKTGLFDRIPIRICPTFPWWLRGVLVFVFIPPPKPVSRPCIRPVNAWVSSAQFLEGCCNLINRATEQEKGILIFRIILMGLHEGHQLSIQHGHTAIRTIPDPGFPRRGLMRHRAAISDSPQDKRQRTERMISLRAIELRHQFGHSRLADLDQFADRTGPFVDSRVDPVITQDVNEFSNPPLPRRIGLAARHIVRRRDATLRYPGGLRLFRGRALAGTRQIGSSPAALRS